MYQPDEQFYLEINPICSSINDALTGQSCSLNNQSAIIESIGDTRVLLIASAPTVDIELIVNQNSIIKHYMLYTALNCGSLTLSTELKDLIMSYKESLEQANKEAFDRYVKIERLKQEMHRNEEKAAKKAEAESERLEKLNKKFMSELSGISKNLYKADDEFFVAIGWLTKNAGMFSARIPTVAEKWFTKEFGDMKYIAVNPSEKTSGGFSKIFAPGFHASIKKSAADSAPSLISKNITNNNFYNTAFIYELVRDYGFEFGKKPNYDSIIENIPSDKLSSFLAGYQS